jgi:hypothetical protein
VAAPDDDRRAKVMGMRVDIDEAEIIERVAALDIGKAEVVAASRSPARAGGACRKSAQSRQ